MINSGLDSNTNYQIYTAAFYFIVTTMATVGYGDISGKNTLERIILLESSKGISPYFYSDIVLGTKLSTPKIHLLSLLANGSLYRQ